MTNFHENALAIQLRAEIGALEKRLEDSNQHGRTKDEECSRLNNSLEAANLLQQSWKSTNLDELLETFGKLLFSFPGVEGCVVHLIQESGATLVMKYVSLPKEFSDIENTYHGFQYRIDQDDVNAQVFKTGKSARVCAENLGDFAETTRMRFERWKMRSKLVVPLTMHHKDGTAQQIGTIALFSLSSELDAQLAEPIELLGSTFASQIHIHWKYQQAVERRQVVEAMSAEIQQFVRYITEMNSLTSVDQVYESIANEFIQRFHFDLVNILLSDGKELAMVHTSFSQPFKHLYLEWEPFRAATKYSLDVHDGQTPLIFSNNLRFMIDDTMKVLHLPMSEKDKRALELFRTPRTFLILPIRLNAEAIGVMWLVSLSEPLPLSESDLTLIDLLSSFISTAIRNAQVHTMVEQQNAEIDSLNHDLQSKIILLDQVARKDHLTGLNNFGNFEEELKRRTSEYSRSASDNNLSLILVDIDHFKLFNDTYGHPAGNEVLREVAARILKAVRDMDFVARYGGEEFAILLPHCGLSDAAAIAERIRLSMAEQPFIIDGKQNHITVSGGYAQFNKNEDPRDLLSRVDSALYRAKNLGRNRIEKAVDSQANSVR
ncbi:MAG: sensor domain-containing diguanylate cyclase [Burkholderiaceae bacterium]